MTRRYVTKPIDSGVDACFGESARNVFRGDLRIMASKRVRIVSVAIEIEEYADEQPTEQPQFVAIVEAKTQPDEQRWLKYALPLVEHQKNLAKGLAMGLRSALAQGTPIAEREEEIKMLLNMVATS